MKSFIKIGLVSLLFSGVLIASDSCYENVCCGKTAGDAKVLSTALSSSFNGYKLVGSGVCDILGFASMLGQNGVEGALYKKGRDSVQISLNMDDSNGGILRETKKNLDSGYSVGMVNSIEDYSDNGSYGDVKVIEGKLMPMKQQTMELIIDSKTTLTITRISKTGREMPLDYFVQIGGAIDLSALKDELGSDNQASSDVEDDSDVRVDSHNVAQSGGSSKPNTDVEDAVNLLKSFF